MPLQSRNRFIDCHHALACAKAKFLPLWHGNSLTEQNREGEAPAKMHWEGEAPAELHWEGKAPAEPRQACLPPHTHSFLALFGLMFFPSLLYAQGNAANPAPATNSAANDTLFSIIFSGGPVGVAIMVALIALSIVTVYLVIDQIITLRRKNVVPADLGENVRQLLSQGRVKEADQLCRTRPCPLAFVLVSGMAEIEFGWPAVEKALEESLAEQAARLYRRIEYLSVIGNLAPMLGLLGTVAGMIVAFRQVALSQGSAGAADLASGIYSALVTTVVGLVIAIPALGIFSVFRNRVDQLVAETAYLAQQVFAPVRRRIPGATAQRPVVPPTAPPRS